MSNNEAIRNALQRLQEYASAHPEHDTDRLLAAALAAEQGPTAPDEVREAFDELERRQENLHRFRDLRTALAAEPPAPADSQPTHSQYFSSHHAIAGEVVKILEDAGLAAAPPAPDPHEALAARPLLEQVARMGDRIGQHTVGEIAAISDRAAAWLAENQPGQLVAIEPRGCPTPGACSCVEPPAPDPDPYDFQTFQGLALDMVESLRPIVIPEILGVLRKAIKSTGEPAPAGDGEREELASALEVTGSHEIPSYEKLRRAAALLRELETIAFAASDYLCAKKFPAFASEHGGLDLLEANLSRLVAHFEHGPQPVPGVDVPGPDGDYGGIQELCNAEGVDVRIGAPLLRRALAAWKQTQPPQGGEAAE